MNDWERYLIESKAVLQDRYGLTAHQSEGYVMRYLDGKTAAEIARMWSIRTRGVNSLLYEVRQKMRGMR